MTSSDSFDRIKLALESIPLHERYSEFVKQLQRVGLDIRQSDKLYSIYSHRGPCIPHSKWRELSNTVITFDEYPKVVAIGTPDLYRPASEKLNKIFDEAMQIEEILFGTVCWLYYFEGRWMLGTKRQPDSGKTTLRKDGPTLLEELIRIARLTTDFDVTRLDPNFSYGFVLYSNRIHRYAQRGIDERLWHVSTRCVHRTETHAEGESIYIDLGLDGPIVHWSSLHNPSDESKEVRSKEKTIADLCMRSSNSFMTKSLGFIVRTMTTSWIIKSPLYIFIDEHIGKNEPSSAVICRVAFSPIDEQERFHSIFSNMAPMRQRVDQSLRQLANMVVDYYDRIRGDTRYIDSSTHLGKLVDSLFNELEMTDKPVDTVYASLLHPNPTQRSAIVSCITSMLYNEDGRIEDLPDLPS